MDLLSLIFPHRCLGCRELGAYICPSCVNLFMPLHELYCPICRRPSEGGKTHKKCSTKYSIDGVMSGYKYAGLMIKAILKFKYSMVSDLTNTLVELMETGVNHPVLFSYTWELVPVPLHSKRLKWRGFNQADLLATGLSKSWQMSVNNTLLVRSRATLPQMKLSGMKRRHNLRGAFGVNKKFVVPKHILLVDDVTTTGSTLNECALALKRAGAKQVWGLTLAQKIPLIQ